MIIAAGLDGIKNNEELPPAVNKNLFSEDVKDLEKLPQDLKSALKLAEESEFVKTVLDEKTLNTYVSLKRNSKDPEFGEL